MAGRCKDENLPGVLDATGTTTPQNGCFVALERG